MSNVPSILGVRLSYRLGLRLHFPAGEPGDLLFEHGRDTGPSDPFFGMRYRASLLFRPRSRSGISSSEGVGVDGRRQGAGVAGEPLGQE